MSQRRTATPRGAKKKADTLFSLIVRAHGECEKCGRRDNLQTAHIISRRYSATRCDTRNAFCLCGGCHHYFTDHPLAFAVFCHEQRSPEDLDELNLKSQSRDKVDWSVVAAELNAQWKAMSA